MSFMPLLLLLVAVASMVDSGAVIQHYKPEGRYLITASTTSTVTQLTTSFLTGTTTTTLLTARNCAVISASTFCRRKRQSWLDIPILMDQDPDIDAYFRQQFEASPVFKVEPTQLVQFRNDAPKEDKHHVIESSQDEPDAVNVRAADPFGISSAIAVKTSLYSTASSIIYQLVFPPVTSTSTVTAYSTTATVNVFTTTKSYTISGCIPPNLSYTAC